MPMNEEKQLQRRSHHDDDEKCFKSSASMATATLASSSAIILAYTIASFVLSLYMHTNFLLLVVSSRFWCSCIELLASDRIRSRLRAWEISVWCSMPRNDSPMIS
mmetsp:Transcript_31279/g.63009  ORF Transcript_31279/g.63009 Transcript_31279/m.63009 type:complete len:105 (+) Transcript_31279:126-440(+)